MEAGLPAIVVTDASVLINFLRINRMDLIADHSHDFVVTNHVAEEVTSRYPEQQRRFALAVDTGAISQVSVSDSREIAIFESLMQSRRLGAGECSAIAMALCGQHVLAIDDRRAKTEARRTDQALQILNTQDLMASMIAENLLDITEADGIKNEWRLRHRFWLKIQSFREVVC